MPHAISDGGEHAALLLTTPGWRALFKSRFFVVATMAERKTECLPVPHALLDTTRRLLTASVKKLGVQVSVGLGSDSKIPIEEIFTQLLLLPKDEARKLFDEANLSFSSRGEYERSWQRQSRSRKRHGDGKNDEDKAEVAIELEKLFEPGPDSEQCPTSVLALGGAGSGKSTVFLPMLGYLFCVKGLWSNKFDLVFGVELRDEAVQKAKSLQELLAAKFESELDMSEKEVEKLAEYFREAQNRLCVVVDGLDECGELSSCSRYMQNLLNRKSLAGAHLIVTSRVCEAARTLSQCGEYQRQLEVEGFSECHVREFVGKVVVGDGKADGLLAVIDRNAELAGMMRTPLFAGLACGMFIDGKEISSCCSALYESMILRIFERSCGKVFKSLADIPPVEMQALLELGRFSFRMLAEKKLIFEERQLDSARLSEKARRLGLLMTFKDGSAHRARQYRFVHLSIQEFLSAWFMKQCVVVEACDAAMLVECLGECSGHLTMFWRFLIAMCNDDVAYPLMENLWRRMKSQPRPFFLPQVFLNIDLPAATSAIRLADEMIHNPGVLCNDTDFERVEHGLAVHLQHEEMKKLANALLEKSHGKGNGHGVVESEMSGGREFTDRRYLQTLLSVWREHAEVTRGRVIYDALEKISLHAADACKEYLQASGPLCDVEVTTFEQDGLYQLGHFDDVYFLQLLEAYWEHSQYQGTVGGVSSCPVIAKILQTSGMDMGNQHLSLRQCNAVAHALHRHVNVVKKVNLANCCIGNEGLLVLAPALSQCTYVSKLNLWANWITDGGLLAAVVSGMSACLLCIDVCFNPIGDEGFQLLSQSLKKCKDLTELWLKHMSLSGASLPAIAMVIEECPMLEELTLVGNYFRTASRDAEVHLVHACASHPNLKKIDFKVDKGSLFLRLELHHFTGKEV